MGKGNEGQASPLSFVLCGPAHLVMASERKRHPMDDLHDAGRPCGVR